LIFARFCRSDISIPRRHAIVSVAFWQPTLEITLWYWNSVSGRVSSGGKPCDSPMTAWKRLVGIPPYAERWWRIEMAPALSPPRTT
jgi:hypothetical protein